MSLIKSMPPEDRSAERLVYRPLSGLALASIFLAGTYALVLTVVCGVAFFTGQAVPLGRWTLLFPLAAAVLAVMARRHVRNSEGTLTGLGLADAAWWLSIVFGLGYTAFYYGTYYAVYGKAREFTNTFIDQLRKGDVNTAFLLTQDPEQRESDKAVDAKRLWIRYGMSNMGRRGPLPTFQENELVRILQPGGSDVTVEEIGVDNWEYDRGSYYFKQTYRLSSAEGVFDAKISVRSKDSPQGRRWQVVWGEDFGVVGEPQLTDFGKGMQNFRNDAVRFGVEWVQKRHMGNVEDAYLDTREPPERNRLRRDYRARLAVAQLAATGSVLASAGQDSVLAHLTPLYVRELNWTSYLPGFREFAAGTFIRSDRLDAPRKWKDQVNTELRGIFRSDSTVLYKVQDVRGRPLPLQPNADRYRLVLNIDFEKRQADAASSAPRYQGSAELQVESDAGPITPRRTPQWRVLSLDLLTAGDAQEDPRKMMMQGGEGAAQPGP